MAKTGKQIIQDAIDGSRSQLDEARTAREKAVAQGAAKRRVQRAIDSDARRAEAEYKTASDLLKSTPGGFETMLKYRQGGYDTPEERSVPYGMPVRPGTKLTNGDGGVKKMFFDRAPDPARDIYQQAQEAEAKRLRDTVPIDDYMKLQSGYRWKQLTPGVDGPVNPYAQPVRTGNGFYENQRDLGYESAQSVMKQWAQLRLNAIDSEISKYNDYLRVNDTDYGPGSAEKEKEYGDRIKALESERANLERAYGLEPRAADWGGVLGNSSMRGISSFDLSIANTLDLLGYAGQKALMLGDLTREQWEEMNMPTTALKNRLQAEHDRSDRLTNEAAGDSRAAQFVGNLTTGTVAALPQAVLAFFTGGASLGTTAGLNAASAAATGGLGTTIYNYVSAMAQNPSFWMSFAQTAGNGFEDAKADGAGDLAAMSYAIINGLLNAGVEVSGGIEQLPANVRGGGAPLRAWIESSLDEGKEEVIQGIIERGLQSFVYGKNNPLFSVSNPDAVFNPLTSLEEGGMGTIIGALLGGGQALAQTGINAINARQSAPASAGAAADVRAGTDTAVEQNAAQSGVSGVQEQVGADTAATTAQAQQSVEDVLAGKPVEGTGGKKSGTVVHVLRSKLPELSLLPSVARVDGTELPSQGNASSRALEFLQKIGNKVTRSGFGDVLFSRSKVKNALVGHGTSAAKIETIAAVPAVIEHGAQVDYVENYEGRGYDTYVFAAPVTYRDSTVYLGVVVAKDAQSGRYYVHEVVDSDGNMLLKNTEPESASDRPSANAAAPVHSQTPLESNVPQSAEAVNNEIHHGVGAAEAGFTEPGHETNQVPSRSQALTDNADFTDEARADAAQSVHDHYRLSNEQQRQMAEFRIDRDEAGGIADLDSQARELLEQQDWGRIEADASLILAKAAHDRGDMQTFRDLTERYAKETTNAGQILQSTQKNIRTPEGKVAQAMQAVDEANERLTAAQKAAGKKITLTDAEINRIYSLQQQANEARPADAELADRLEGEANKIIAGKLEKPFKQKLLTFFYNNMLGNLRTLLTRNAGGNLGLAAVDQTLTKANSAVVDALIGKITGERFYAMPGAKYYREYGRGFAKGVRDAYADYSTGIRTPRSGEQWNAKQAVNAQYQVFKSDLMQGIDRLVKFGLDIGDRPFYEATYKSRLEELTRLRDSRRLSPEQTASFDEWAPAEAAVSALEAVFQQRGDGAEGLGSIRTGIGKLVKALTGVDMGGMAALPFTSTPGNVLDTTTDYIPLTGAVKNAVNTLREVRRGEFNQRRFSKATGRLLTGLELTAGAAGLAAAGAITGGGDDRSDKEALEQSGWQDYSFKVGNKYYSYDWIPIVGTILAGTADYLDAREYGEESIFGAAKTSLGTVGGMTALQGMNRMFGGYSGNIAAGLIGNLTALPGQAIPSVVGQTARATDSYERDTYDPRWWKQELNYLMNRVPGLRETLPERIDLYGQPVELSDGRNIASKLFENLVSPGYLSEEQSDAVTQELLRLSDSGNAVSIPDVEKTAGLDGDGRNVKLTAEQYKQRQITRGQTLATVLTSAIGSPSYALLTDEQKAWVAEQAVKYAGAAANKELFENAGAEYTGNDYTDRLELSEVGTYLAYRAAFRELTDVQDEPSQEDFDVIKALLGQYNKVPEDVQTALDDVDGFKRFRQAAAKGIKLEHILAFGEANKTREEFKDVDRDGKYGKADKRWYFMQDGGTKSEFDKLWEIWNPGNSGK